MKVYVKYVEEIDLNEIDSITDLKIGYDSDNEFFIKHHFPNLKILNIPTALHIPDSVTKLSCSNYICEDYKQLVELILMTYSKASGCAININPLVIEYLQYTPSRNYADLQLMSNLKKLTINGNYDVYLISDKLIKYHGFNGMGEIPPSVKILTFRVVNNYPLKTKLDKLTLRLIRNDIYINISNDVEILRLFIQTVLNINIELNFPAVRELEIYNDTNDNADYLTTFINQYNNLESFKIFDEITRYYDFPNLSVNELKITPPDNALSKIVKTSTHEFYDIYHPYDICPSPSITNLYYTDINYKNQLVFDLPLVVEIKLHMNVGNLVLFTPCLKILTIIVASNLKIHPLVVDKLYISSYGLSIDCHDVKCEKLIIYHVFEKIIMPYGYCQLELYNKLSQNWLNEDVHTLIVGEYCIFDDINAPYLKKLTNYSKGIITVSANCVID